MHEQPQNPPSAHRVLLHRIAVGLHALVLLAAVGMVVYAASPLLRKPPSVAAAAPQPSTMEEVDWESPYSSIYCLACHRQVAPAMGDRNVHQGHSQNITLKPEQIQAVQDLGAVLGPDNTLICMSCHKLGAGGEHMLADTTTGSKLCEHCHPDHFKTVGGKHDLRVTAPHEKNRFDQTAESGGPCSACHLSHRYARDYEPSELDPDGRCITCHKIGRAAEKLSRPTMEHPDSHCVVCHNPHDDTNQHYLKKPGAQMCGDCHTDYVGGLAMGMHPLGAMKYDIPEMLVAAGAETFGNPRDLTCVVCHSTHSGTHEPLLILPADTNQLCLSCHDKDLAAKAAGGAMCKHGQSPKLTAQQRTVVEGRGGRVGPDGELLCVSCHKVHKAEPDSSLQVFRPKFEDACSACHPDKMNVAGTAHDLRLNLLDDKSIMDQASHGSALCNSCHTAHGPARSPAPTAGDISGHCATCHQETGLAKSKTAGRAGHPDSKCTACHDPHKQDTPDFLLQPGAELCRTCHADQYLLVGGPHDRAKHPEKWLNAPVDADGPCAVCHVSHGMKGTGLFRATVQADSYHDAICLVCHPTTRWKSGTGVAAIHPQQVSPEQKRVPVSLVPTDDQGNMRMGCRTCHDVHGGAEPVHLARVKADEPTATLCTHCHQDKTLITMTSHAPERLTKLGFDVDSCKPCHAMHAEPAHTWGLMLSPRFLVKAEDAVGLPVPGSMVCESCHRNDGVAPIPGAASHPAGFMFNTIKPDEPGYMPLFAENGLVDEYGQVTCRTCHLAHGRGDLLEAAAASGEGPPVYDSRRAAAKMQLRSFTTPNLCTQCHGNDARRRYLFFHDPVKRKPANT
jgi:predicted CXXCH cytochrome family protein